jgi:hypothetical protein
LTVAVISSLWYGPVRTHNQLHTNVEVPVRRHCVPNDETSFNGYRPSAWAALTKAFLACPSGLVSCPRSSALSFLSSASLLGRALRRRAASRSRLSLSRLRVDAHQAAEMIQLAALLEDSLHGLIAPRREALAA